MQETQRWAPATKKVRVLYVGDIGWETWRDISEDPFLTVQPVAATMLIAGFVLWSLMIRRRIYREVKTTRFTF